ncbi:hypothetical protein D3C71_1241160 [compost metagenome]
MSGANPGAEYFFTFAHAQDHVPDPLRRMDGGGNGHACQIQETVVCQQCQFTVKQLAELLANRQVRVVDGVFLRGDVGPQSLQNFREQLFFTGEVVVHGALGHACRRSDLVHAGDVETVGAEFGNRRLNDGFAFTVGQAL